MTLKNQKVEEEHSRRADNCERSQVKDGGSIWRWSEGVAWDSLLGRVRCPSLENVQEQYQDDVGMASGAGESHRKTPG